eukprot:CAMPEP_0202732992 /NCGR_PEP_ID=MMETSP1385-20130828/187940_1 /ASSEMBLY_ACC=CAM_ASM_000861 /TAXON_ID=933848 /ORGANISM="Elphidium margaritaceum" /LENGTH=325 /DNA_ID=CAMNT_0049399315 /DNA_START=164 /DNA_END=1138 /DNA_ORIENTATION=+
MDKHSKKIQQHSYKKNVKQTQFKKINNFGEAIDSIASSLCANWFVVEHTENNANTCNDDHYQPHVFDIDCNSDITALFGKIYNNLPNKIYRFWFEKPEVDDPIYGLDPDCESPHLFESIKQGGYSPHREIRHRCAMFNYMKAQRRCARPEFFELFDLEDNFLVELQILALHLWIIKTRMNYFASPVCNQLSYEIYRIMFNEFGVRFEKHISGSRHQWELDCQHACLYLAVALDEVWDSFQMDRHRHNIPHYNPYIFAKVIWSEIYLLNENISLDVLYLWSQYIFDEMIALRKVNDFEFLNGYWKFGALPTLHDRQRTKKDIVKFK